MTIDVVSSGLLHQETVQTAHTYGMIVGESTCCFDPKKQTKPSHVEFRRTKTICKSHDTNKRKYSHNLVKRSKISTSGSGILMNTMHTTYTYKDANWIPRMGSPVPVHDTVILTDNQNNSSTLSGLISTLTNTSRSTSSASQAKQQNATNGKQSNMVHDDNNSDSDDFDQRSDDNDEDDNAPPPKKPTLTQKPLPTVPQKSLITVAYQMIDCLHECAKQQRPPSMPAVQNFMEQLKPWIPLVFSHNSDGTSRVKPKSKSESVPYYTVTIPIQSIPTVPKIKTETSQTITPAIPTPSHTTTTVLEPLVSISNKTEQPIPKHQEQQISSPSITPPLTEAQPKKRGRKPKSQEQQPIPKTQEPQLQHVPKPIELEIPKPAPAPVEEVEEPLPPVVQVPPLSPPIPKVSITPSPDLSKRKQPRFQWLGEPSSEDSTSFSALLADGVVYCVGDCVHMESGDENVPFIGVIAAFFQKGTKKMIGTTWFYRASDVPIFTQKEISKIPKNELFTSPDYNENTVSMIIRKCTVRHVSQVDDLEEYSRKPFCYYYNKSWDPHSEQISPLEQPIDGINIEDKSLAYGKRPGPETNPPPAKIPKKVSVNHSLATIEAFMKGTVGQSSETNDDTAPTMTMDEDYPAPRKNEEAKKEETRPQSDLPSSTPQSEYGIPILENLIPEFPQIGKRTKPQPKKSTKPPSKSQSPPKRALARPSTQQQQPESFEPMIAAPDYDDSPSMAPSSPPPSQFSSRDKQRTLRTSSSTSSAPSLWKEVNSGEEYNRILADAPNTLIVREYHAVWCTPCVRARPKMEKLAENFKDRNVIFIRTDVDEGEDPGILNTSVKNLPTYTLVVGGKILGSVVGTDEAQLTQAVETHLKQLERSK